MLDLTEPDIDNARSFARSILTKVLAILDMFLLT